MINDILTVRGRRAHSSPALVSAPPSKSISHRMLVAACLAAGESRLENVLESADTRATSEILTRLGAKIRPEGGDLLVDGLGGRLIYNGKEPLDCYVHESGTTCRLLTAVLAAGKGNFYVHGSPRMSERPMRALTEMLESLGAGIHFENRTGYLPFRMTASGLDRGGETMRDGGELLVETSQTSQYLSGLLLAAPLGSGLRLIPTAGAAEALVSWSYAQLTLQTLRDFGISFKVESRESLDAEWKQTDWEGRAGPASGLWRITVCPGVYRAGEYRVEGDFSNASYLLGAGAAGKRPVRVGNLNPQSMQGDREILSILQRMGASVSIQKDSVEVAPPEGGLKGIEVNMGDCPDIVPTVAAVAAFAKGPTRISGVAHLRIKESDRIAAPAAELRKVGCEVRELDDGMVVIPPLKLKAPAEPFDTYNDHRMAMSMSILSCAGFDVQIKNPDCVGKSFPGFWEEWAGI